MTQGSESDSKFVKSVENVGAEDSAGGSAGSGLGSLASANRSSYAEASVDGQVRDCGVSPEIVRTGATGAKSANSIIVPNVDASASSL